MLETPQQTQFAPIVLFVYNRPYQTTRTVASLRANPEAAKSQLFIYCDGPKKQTDIVLCEAVREIIRNIDGFKRVTLIESDINRGLANSIIRGVTQVVAEFGRAIILEDDLETSPHFLNYMNSALDLYQHEERVISIHGYRLPFEDKIRSNFFLRGADCWGWATWKRGWDLFEPDGKKLYQELSSRKLLNRFNFDGEHPFSQMLLDQIAGRNNSWAIRWHASAFLRNKLTLYPKDTMVLNIGFDGSGVHCDSLSGNIYAAPVSQEMNVLSPIDIAEDEDCWNLHKKFYKQTRPTRIQRLFSKAKRKLRFLGLF